MSCLVRVCWSPLSFLSRLTKVRQIPSKYINNWVIWGRTRRKLAETRCSHHLNWRQICSWISPHSDLPSEANWKVASFERKFCKRFAGKKMNEKMAGEAKAKSWLTHGCVLVTESCSLVWPKGIIYQPSPHWLVIKKSSCPGCMCIYLIF